MPQQNQMPPQMNNNPSQMNPMMNQYNPYMMPMQQQMPPMDPNQMAQMQQMMAQGYNPYYNPYMMPMMMPQQMPMMDPNQMPQVANPYMMPPQPQTFSQPTQSFAPVAPAPAPVQIPTMQQNAAPISAPAPVSTVQPMATPVEQRSQQIEIPTSIGPGNIPRDTNVLGFMMQMVVDKNDSLNDQQVLAEAESLYDRFGETLVDNFQPMLTPEQLEEFDKMVASDPNNQEGLLNYLQSVIPDLSSKIEQILMKYKSDYISK